MADSEKDLKRAVNLAKSKFYKNRLHQKKLARKEIRKNKRLEKKSKQNEFQKKKNHKEENQPVEDVKKKKKKRKRKTKPSENTEGDEMEAYRKGVQETAMKKDDQIINQLGKKLKVNKSAKLPSVFADEGLDYLLEVCEPLNDDFKGDSSDEEYLEMKSKESKKPKKSNKSQAHLYGEDISDEDVAENLLFDDGTQMEDDVENEEMNELSELEELDEFGELEDGNIEHESDSMNEDDENDQGSDKSDHENNIDAAAKYVPPSLRKLPKTDVDKEKINNDRIKKQLKGLVNRISEATLPSIMTDIESLYFKNSRNIMNELLYQIIFDACVSTSRMPDRLLIEHMVVVASLHTSIGAEIGSYFLEMLIAELQSLYSKDITKEENKELHNVVFLLTTLYNFKVVHCVLISDIIHKLLERFQEIDIEIILMILKACGSDLRKDDPGALKEIILEVQAKAVTSELRDQSRVRFMLDVINALKNNNMRKIPQYDPTVMENMKKVRKHINSGKGVQLKVSLEDLLQVKNKGRWWIVGSAWSGHGPIQNDKDTTKSKTSDAGTEMADASVKLLDIAKQQRMNTNLRKTIFCTMMTSEDYADAFERLLKLNLKEKQAREIIHVLVECCLQEKKYNPFYAYLSDKFCEYSKSNQVTLQFTFWDRFKVLSSLNKHSSTNLCKLLAHSVASKSLSLSALKVVSFGVLDKPSIKFFIKFFKMFLLEYPENVIIASFQRLSNQPKLSLLREGLKIFLRHFLLPSKTSDVNIHNTRLIELIEKSEAAIDGRDYVPL